MDKKELALIDIYKSIELTLKLLHVKLKEVKRTIDKSLFISNHVYISLVLL